VGIDGKGLAYFKNPDEEELLLIGLNPDPDENRPEKWTLLRRVPVVPTTFDFYGKNLLPAFDKLNNWKYASPHNIQRRTSQNRECNNCHGNKDLFLTGEKLKPGMLKANSAVMVPDDQIPEKQDVPETEKKPAKKKSSYF
jgi:thiosulfate/3-mercaptopyruvate sulfurtransferase